MAEQTPRTSRRRVVPEYSPIGTFIVISLAMFCLVVVPIKLAVDASPWAAIVVVAMIAVLCVSVLLAGSVPVVNRPRREYKRRPPMDVDVTGYDSTRDGVSW